MFVRMTASARFGRLCGGAVVVGSRQEAVFNLPAFFAPACCLGQGVGGSFKTASRCIFLTCLWRLLKFFRSADENGTGTAVFRVFGPAVREDFLRILIGTVRWFPESKGGASVLPIGATECAARKRTGFRVTDCADRSGLGKTRPRFSVIARWGRVCCSGVHSSCVVLA